MTDGSGNSDRSESHLPAEIRAFERVQITAVVVGWMNASVAYHQSLQLQLNPILFTGGLSALSALVFLMMARASRSRCKVSRWLIVGLSGLLIVPWFGLLIYISPFNINGLLLLMQGGLQFAACSILLGRTAQSWFASPGELP